MKVITTLGLVSRGELEVKDSITENDNSCVWAREWYLAGEMVRRDVLINMFNGLEMGATNGGG